VRGDWKWIAVVGLIVLGVVLGSYLVIFRLVDTDNFCSHASSGKNCPVDAPSTTTAP
jgi:hypothetical protein